MHGQARRLVADRQMLVLPENVQMPLLGLERAFRCRQVHPDDLPDSGFGIAAHFRHAVHGTGSGLHGLLQRGSGKMGRGRAQNAVQPLPGLLGRNREAQTLHLLSAGVDRVRSRSARVVS